MILLIFSSVRAHAADADPAAAAYRRALSQYASGDVAAALASMRESHRLSGRSELLYNIARLEDEAGDCAASLSDYRQYLELVPHGQYREAATKASAKLGASCHPAAEAAPSPSAPPTTETVADSPASAGVVTTSAAATPTPEPQSPAPGLLVVDQPKALPRANPSGNTRRFIGWSAVAAGAIAGVGAVYFTVSAVDARRRFLHSTERESMGGPYADWGLQDEQHRDQHWAQALAITGGALLGGGVLFLVFGGRTPASASVTAGLWLEPNRMSAQLSSSF